MNITTCTTCGQAINEIVIIDSKPYGTTCAERKLGIKKLPSWFSGGDWDQAKKDRELFEVNRINEYNQAILITSEFWSEWHMLSNIYKKAYQQNNNFLSEFMSSIIRQLGYPCSLTEAPINFEDAKKNPNTFLLYSTPKRYKELSPKQLAIIDKYL
jgi:hypothetical protein